MGRCMDYNFIFFYAFELDLQRFYKLYILHSKNNAYSNNDEHIIYLQNNRFFKGIHCAYNNRPTYKMNIWLNFDFINYFV